MAFNPIKNYTTTEAPLPKNSENQTIDQNEELVSDYISIEQPELEFEGKSIEDLEKSGLETINLLKVAPTNPTDKVKFNIPLLESLPISFVLESLGAKKSGTNSYILNLQEISIKENKWYNKTKRRGNINSISLMKHIISIEENVDEFENQKTLFIAACKKLTALQNSAHNNDKVMDKAYIDQDQLKPKKEFKYEPSSAVKQAQDKSANNSSKIDWKLLTEQLNNIPLNLVMEHIGANPNEDNHRGKWKVWKTGHNIQITGQKWHSWNSQKGGFGGISLLAFQLGIENNIDDRLEENKKALRKMAIKELIKVFGTEYNLNSLGGENIDTSYFKEPFSMPHVIDFKINQVRQYLNEKRHLPMWVINKQINSGSLFAGYPSDWEEDPHLHNPDKLKNEKVWATFLAINGNAAEMRAIDRSDQFAKILAKGSDKELGGFLIKAEKDCNEKTVVACEAAIDTMSYHAFYPGRIVTSCMGVNFNLAVKSAVEALDHNFKFQLAFDNDLAGNEAAVRFKEQLINEIGEEEYNNQYQNNNIGYFDLGIRCLRKTIEKGGVYYFDVKYDDMGRKAAIMFQDQLFKSFEKEDVKQLIAKGKIKYANIAPSYHMLPNNEQDIYKEAEKSLKILLSNKKLYIVLKHGDEDEKDDIKAKRLMFEKAFLDVSKQHITNLQASGQIIYKKQALAKDWNEFYIVMKKDPRFLEKMQNLEQKYSHYSENLDSGKKSTKRP